jgi:hypothetical protein
MSTQQVPNIEQIRGAWNSIAGGFDEFVTPKTLVLGEEVMRRLELRPGMRLLDVAAGSGGLSIPAARVGAEVGRDRPRPGDDRTPHRASARRGTVHVARPSHGRACPRAG